jgi:ubiquinone/menaquinone biosynthesis C-methylase UbiE
MGHRVTGIDPSPEMLEVARTKGLPATFVPGSFDPLPLPDDSVDLVTCALALTHVSDLGPPIAEMARIVRHCGRVVLSDVRPTATVTGGQALLRRVGARRRRGSGAHRRRDRFRREPR